LHNIVFFEIYKTYTCNKNNIRFSVAD